MRRVQCTCTLLVYVTGERGEACTGREGFEEEVGTRCSGEQEKWLLLLFVILHSYNTFSVQHKSLTQLFSLLYYLCENARSRHVIDM